MRTIAGKVKRTFRRLTFTALVAGLLGSCSTGWAQSARRDAVRTKVSDLIEEVRSAEVKLNVSVRKSKILRTKEDVLRVAIADPEIIEFVAFGPREMQIIGKQSGSTTMTLWLGQRAQIGAAPVAKSRVLSILVTVSRDKAVEDRRRLQYSELQNMLNEMFHDSKIQLIPIADKLLVRGQARDEKEATLILSIIRERGTGIADSDGFDSYGGNINLGTAASPFPDAEDSALPEASIIDMLNVPGEKQVMLKVRIAELSRSAVRSLGLDFQLNLDGFFLASTLVGGGNIFASQSFDNQAFSLTLNALASNGAAKILAEPNLVVLSGETATFHAGGQFAVPTTVGIGGAQAATTSFKGFGTQLTFTPTILDKDRIRLNIASSFSTLNSGNSVQGIFGVDTRSVTTTVDLREGQVLAIAGLLQDQQSGATSRIPFIGDIPILSKVFANKTISRDEKELIILVTPELVHPLEAEEAPALLPGMEMTEPDDWAFFVLGHIEGDPCCDHRSTVWPMYKYRYNKSYREYKKRRRTEKFYIRGSHGFSN